MDRKPDEVDKEGKGTSEIAALCESAGEEARPAAQVQQHLLHDIYPKREAQESTPYSLSVFCSRSSSLDMCKN